MAIEDEFGIRFCDEKGSIRKAFNLKENEYLFHSEGSMFKFSDKLFKDNTLGAFKVDQLYDPIIIYKAKKSTIII